MSGRIVQFGTSRFLQAHADLMLHEARMAGQPVGPITIVQTTAAAARAGRVDAFNRGDGFPVAIRGLDGGRPVDRTVTVTIVDQGLSAARDWAQLVALFEGEAEWVISNTGDTGYAVAADDPPLRFAPDAERPASFPAMLALLLWRRWRAGAPR